MRLMLISPQVEVLVEVGVELGKKRQSIAGEQPTATPNTCARAQFYIYQQQQTTCVPVLCPPCMISKNWVIG